MDYLNFLEAKSQLGGNHGFEPIGLPDAMFDFQKFLTEWAIRKGRAAIFADCGLGKSLCQLSWADNVSQHTNRPVLIATPLAVSSQTVAEAEKFGITAKRSRDGKIDSSSKIWVTNYEQIEKFDQSQFCGMVCDESSAIKDFKSRRKEIVTEFMRLLPYRLLCTATAAPNDYHELGTSSEALGELGFRDMITKFFVEDEKKGLHGWGRLKYRLRGHAERPFWRWVCSWARACRKPSDLGFSDDGFILPPLVEHEHVVKAEKVRPGMLFSIPARSLREEREGRRISIEERCQLACDIVSRASGPSVVWCHLNDEGDELERVIPGAVQVSGSMNDDVKEERLLAFAKGEISTLVTKPKIGCWGLNWQHCANVTIFASHSYEQYYQAVRRCWRFGQKNKVEVNVIASEGEIGVLKNMQRKSAQASRMFESLVSEMVHELSIVSSEEFNVKEMMPVWL